MPKTSRRIGLEVDDDGGQLHGRLAGDDGQVHEFEGWLGLLSILADLLDAPSPGGAKAPPSKHLE